MSQLLPLASNLSFYLLLHFAYHIIAYYCIVLQVKVDAKVQVPEVLDLTPFRGMGLQPGEVLIPDTDGR